MVPYRDSKITHLFKVQVTLSMENAVTYDFYIFRF